MKLTVSQPAPDFTLPDQHGQMQTLSSYRGSWVIVYFYPKDDTPGCTIEACQFRDNLPDFKKLGMQVLGISKDSVRSHDAFAKKFTLPFPLLADESRKVIEEYGVWGEKNFMGRDYMGILRTSFLINPEGKIAKIYEEVRPKTHIQEVLKDLKKLTHKAN